ncbi:MAG: TetR family transcriptional regulator [Anaerolineales bacterium]|nr:TetR family transcriptional regulator [Anaerolineales bacterium]
MPRHKDVEREQVMSDTRQRLLDSAIEHFARDGYAGANINDISKSAGYAKGTIYNYFASKRALMLALIEETALLHFEFIAERVYQEEDARNRMECFFKAGFDFVSTYLAKAQVMVNNLYGHDAEFKQVMFQAYLPMFELVGKDILALGLSQQVFRQVDPVSTTNLLMLAYLGIGSQVNDEGKTWVDAKEVADFVLNSLQV